MFLSPRQALSSPAFLYYVFMLRRNFFHVGCDLESNPWQGKLQHSKSSALFPIAPQGQGGTHCGNEHYLEFWSLYWLTKKWPRGFQANMNYWFQDEVRGLVIMHQQLLCVFQCGCNFYTILTILCCVWACGISQKSRKEKKNLFSIFSCFSMF